MHTSVRTLVQRSFTATVVAATLSWSIGLSTLVAPLAARAAVSSGTLVKASTPAVYYVGSDMKRYVFPNEKTYKTWYSDFSGVQVITDAELASLAIGGNVTYKPGTRMVKITTDPKVYAVDAHGVLRWVKTEAAAVALYGSAWNQQIDDVPDAFFTNYSVGADISSASDFDRSAAAAAASSINVDKGGSLVATVSGTLSAILDPQNPGPGSMVGRTGIPVLKFLVTNSGSSAVNLDSLTLHRSGAGALGDLASATLYRNGLQRVASVRTFNSSTNDAEFSGMHIMLSAGETAALSLVIGVVSNPGASDQHVFTLTSVRSGSSIASGLPLTSAAFTVSGANGGLVTVTKSGGAQLANVRAGGMQQKIAEFMLTVASVEDVRILKVALTNAGSVDRTHLSNITLKQAGVTLSTVPGYDQYDRATLFLQNPILIERGSSKTFEVFADITPDTRGGASETVLTYIDAIGDLVSIGQTYGAGVVTLHATLNGGSYDGENCALGAGNCSSAQVEAGQLTLTYNGPAAHDIPTNGKDVELFNVTMAAAANLEVRQTQIALDSVGANLFSGDAKVTDVKIVDVATGAVVAGPKDVTAAATTETLTFNETYSLAAGQSRTFKVTADISNTAAFTSLKASLLAFPGDKIRNLDAGVNLASSDIIPNATIAGNAHSVKTPGVTLSGASTPVAQTYVKGSQDVTLAGITLKAGDASDVKVNTLAIQGLIDSSTTATCTTAPNGTFANGREFAGCASVADVIQTVKLWNGATQIGTTKSPSSNATAGQGGLVTFDNMNLVIPKGQTLTLALSGSLSNALLAAELPDDVRFDVAAAGVTATDPDGNSITATGSSTGPVMRVSDKGAITVALAPDDVESEASTVVGGSSDAVLAKYKLTAQNEELKLTKARIALVTGASASALSSISLYDGATLVGGPSAVDGSGVADFSGMGFVIPKDGSKVLTVKGNLNSIGASGAVTGTNVRVQMNDGSFEVRGTSTGSSTTLATFASTPLNANAKIVRKSKPTIAVVSLPTSVLSTGDQVIQRFTVSADAAGDMAVHGLSLQVSNGTAGTLAKIAGTSGVRRVGDGSDLAGSATLSTCTTGLTCTLDIIFSNEEVIAAGTSRTYDVRMTVGSLSPGDSVSSKLLGDGTTVATGVLAATGTAGTSIKVGGVDSAFVWSDLSIVPHVATIGASSADWANGALVKVLPTDTQSMSK